MMYLKTSSHLSTKMPRSYRYIKLQNLSMQMKSKTLLDYCFQKICNTGEVQAALFLPRVPFLSLLVMLSPLPPLLRMTFEHHYFVECRMPSLFLMMTEWSYCSIPLSLTEPFLWAVLMSCSPCTGCINSFNSQCQKWALGIHQLIKKSSHCVVANYR